MKTTVVILNWNGKKLLEQFLPSVVQFTSEATIYVADNASTDDSIPFLETNFPSVQIIQNTVNGGYAKGYNDALKHLSEELFILLNNDVEVTEDWLSPILEAFRQNPSLAAAQPKIMDFKNKSKFEYAGAAGGFLDQLGYPFCRGRIFDTLEEDYGQYNDSRSIFWATGACLAIRKESFWKAEGFDEDLFAHQEEIDLCWRIQSEGSKIFYLSNSTVYHLGGATLQAANPQKTFYNFRNTLLVLLKNRRGVLVWGLIFFRMWLDGIAGFQFLLQGKPKHFWAILRAHFSFYLHLPVYLKKRKKWASHLPYGHSTSIVWSYFIQKKRTFNKL